MFSRLTAALDGPLCLAGAGTTMLLGLNERLPARRLGGWYLGRIVRQWPHFIRTRLGAEAFLAGVGWSFHGDILHDNIVIQLAASNALLRASIVLTKHFFLAGTRIMELGAVFSFHPP